MSMKKLLELRSRIETQKAKLAELEKRRKALEAKARAMQTSKERRLDARRKIILGGAAIASIRAGNEHLLEHLMQYMSERDRTLFDRSE